MIPVTDIKGYAFDSLSCLTCHAGTISTPSWTNPLKFPLAAHNALCYSGGDQFSITSGPHSVSLTFGAAEVPLCFTCHSAKNTTMMTWGIDWGRFIDIDTRKYDGSDAENQKRLQLAYRIDTSLVNPLGKLPPSVATDPSILALRNLKRGWRLQLPSGQQVAHAMGIPPLADAQIRIGQATDEDKDKKEEKAALTLALELLAHDQPFNLISLKQVRDAADPMLACYQNVTWMMRTVEQVGGINADDFGTLNKALHRLERFWTDQILYRL